MPPGAPLRRAPLFHSFLPERALRVCLPRLRTLPRTREHATGGSLLRLVVRLVAWSRGRGNVPLTPHRRTVYKVCATMRPSRTTKESTPSSTRVPEGGLRHLPHQESASARPLGAAVDAAPRGQDQAGPASLRARLSSTFPSFAGARWLRSASPGDAGGPRDSINMTRGWPAAWMPVPGAAPSTLPRLMQHSARVEGSATSTRTTSAKP